MKNLLIINLFLFTSSSKKLIFVFILLLILPFSGCKSVVKETDVEKPVRIVSPNGEVYVGEIVSGKPHGQGTRTYPGNKYVGEWKDGRWDGQGTWIESDGIKYVGEFKNGKRWNKAFTYDWRLYTPAEVHDALLAAGFSNVETFWDFDENEETCEYLPAKKAENSPGWVAYLVAECRASSRNGKK